MKIDEFHLKDIVDTELTNLVSLMLDLFSETTNWVIAWYNNKGIGRWSNSYELFSPLCNYCRQNPKLWVMCEADHKKRTSAEYFKDDSIYRIAMCHLGLWNISHPISFAADFYGAIITGQRRLAGENHIKQSKDRLDTRLQELNNSQVITIADIHNMMIAFDQVEIIDEFPTPLLHKIADIDNRLLQLLSNLLDRVERRIRRLTLLRHELHEPIISIKNKLLFCVSELDKLKKNVLNDEAINRINNMIKHLKYSMNWSTLFSMIIENISSSMSREMIRPNLKRVNILNIIDNVIGLFQEQADRKDIYFEPIDRISIETKFFEMDPTLITRALVNVYHNAVKYSYYGQKQGEPRTIRTMVCDKPDFFRIEVSNFGTGILKKELESGKIWEEGVRGELSSDRHRTGSGLGLPNIKRIIEAHNGNVYIISIPKSDNWVTGPYLTTITIELPYYYVEKRSGGVSP